MKKIRDTKIGAWLKDKAPQILDVVGDALPDQGMLGVLKNLIDKEPSLSSAEKKELMQMMQQLHVEEQKEITERWKYDTSSNSWLAVNVRPLVLASLIVFLYLFIILDSLKIEYEVKDSWISIYETVLITTIGGYFVVRSIDKNKMPWQR
jgi:hypothetical protein